jgi:hypothetical protein
LSKNFKTLGNTYELLLSPKESQNCENLKDMIIQTMGKIDGQKGTIDDILAHMISEFGKDKVCDHTN